MINRHKTIKRESNTVILFRGIVFVLTIFLFSFSDLASAAELSSEQGRSWKDYLSIVPAILLLLFAFKKMLPNGGSRQGDNCNSEVDGERGSHRNINAAGDGGGD